MFGWFLQNWFLLFGEKIALQKSPLGSIYHPSRFDRLCLCVKSHCTRPRATQLTRDRALTMTGPKRPDGRTAGLFKRPPPLLSKGEKKKCVTTHARPCFAIVGETYFASRRPPNTPGAASSFPSLVCRSPFRPKPRPQPRPKPFRPKQQLSMRKQYILRCVVCGDSCDPFARGRAPSAQTSQRPWIPSWLRQGH